MFKHKPHVPIKKRIPRRRKALLCIALLAVLCVSTLSLGGPALADTTTSYGTYYTDSAANPMTWIRLQSDGSYSATQALHAYEVYGSDTGVSQAYCAQLHHMFSPGEKTEYDALGWKFTSGEVTITQTMINTVALGMKYIDETSYDASMKTALKQVFEWRIVNNDGTGGGIFLTPASSGLSLDQQKELFTAAQQYANDQAANYTCWARIYSNGNSQDIAQYFYKFNGASLTLYKSSADESVTSGNACYSLAGATYTVYTDAACTAAAKDTDGNAAAFTTAENGRGGTLTLAPGSYWIKETKTPDGYRPDTTVYPVTLTEENTSENPVRLDVADVPKTNPLGVEIQKTDAETGLSTPQGSASLAGAEFTIRFYAGYVSEEEVTGQTPTRTWVIQTKEEDGTYRATLDKDHLLAEKSDALYLASDGSALLPLGTYTIAETAAPAGYLLAGSFTDENGKRVDAGSLYYTQLTEDGGSDTGTRLAGGNTYVQSDTPIRGGVMIQKRDYESGRDEPAGNASLKGAVFEIISENEEAILVDGTTYQPGDVVTTLVTDDTGFASTEADLLPYGTYLVSEVEAPEGYLLGSVVLPAVTSEEFHITEDGVIIDLTEVGAAITDQVKRGDFSFTKQDGEDESTMGPIKFRLTSLTTGESHILWTDENGDYSSASAWEPHSQNTNAGESFEDGLWFYGYADEEDSGVEVDDQLGALPFDTYLLEELECEANEGRTLVTTRFTIYRDVTEVGELFGMVNLGTIDDYVFGFSTVAVNAKDGSKVLEPDEEASVRDEITYWGLDRTQTYTFVSELYDLTEGEAVKDGDGEDLTVVTEFTPQTKDGTQAAELTFDASDLADHTLVVFESLYDEDGTLLKSEVDAEEEQQTVTLSETEIPPEEVLPEETTPEEIAPEEIVPETAAPEEIDTPQAAKTVKTGDVATLIAWLVVIAAAAAGVLVLLIRQRRRPDRQ